MKKLTSKQFCNALASNYNAALIVHVGGGLWQARCSDGVLATPEGVTNFDNLTGLLAILAGVGIRAIRVEWDGLPAIVS